MKCASIRVAVLAIAVLSLCAVAAVTPAGAATHRRPRGAQVAARSGNLIVNPGAEHTGRPPNDSGTKVPVTGWKVARRYQFTAVPYGASGFLTKQSHGPRHRGHNFFAGGSDGTHSIGSQTDSLSKWRPWIKTGHARFALSAWLGGFATQNDHTTLTITWQSKTGKALGSASVGPVLSNARHGVTKLLLRTTTGTVPRGAAKVFVKLAMTRTDGVYNDGYADNLSLVITKS